MKLSFIIPVYNCEAYLSECLDSILLQTGIDFEVIVINDGSTDASLALIKSYEIKDTRVKSITVSNSGQASARNLGVTMARGECIWFVDADDVLLGDVLHLLMDKLKGGNVLRFEYKHFMDGARPPKMTAGDDNVFAGLGVDYILEMSRLRRYDVTPWSMIIKADFLRNNSIVFRPGFGHEDHEFVLRLLASSGCTVRHINLIAYGYRLRAGSTTKQGSVKIIEYMVLSYCEMMKLQTDGRQAEAVRIAAEGLLHHACTICVGMDFTNFLKGRACILKQVGVGTLLSASRFTQRVRAFTFCLFPWVFFYGEILRKTLRTRNDIRAFSNK